MHVKVVDCGSKRLPDLRIALRALGCALSTIALSEARAESFSDADAIVISGGPHLFTGRGGEALIERFAFIDHLTAPALGICLGHQAIGIRRGATVFRAQSCRGAERIEVLGRHPLIDLLDDRFELQQDHCEGITAPVGFEILARSAHYANEIMACDSLKLYGVQAHPETSGAQGRSLLAGFLQLAGSGRS